MTIDKTCAGIEAFFEALHDAGVTPFRQVLEPRGETAKAEKALDTKLPTDVAAFLARGLRGATGSFEDGDRFASFGFDWVGVDSMIRTTEMLRGIARDGEDDEHGEVIRAGVVLTYSEPQIVVSDGAVYHFSFRNPMLKISSSFSEFLDAWLASGCFCSHDFELHWSRVKPYVDHDMTPARNPWVRAYKKQFPQF